jgi:GNAT superfamily N-acetyltransferase
MRIVSLEQLPPDLAAAWGTLVWSDQDVPMDTAFLRKARALGIPLADYGGLAVTEGDRVLAQVTVGRYPLTTPEGTETFTGLADVVTLPDALRRGLCRQLLIELHSRERKDGHHLAMLWTRRSWGAHRLYERLGYRDIYSPPTAVLPPHPSTRRLPPNITVRSARRADSELLESLFERATRGRIGFVPRFPNSFEARFALRWRTPTDHHLVFQGSRPVGYFFSGESPRHLAVFEGVVTDRALLSRLVDAMLCYARGRWVAIAHTTLVNDAHGLLEERGFSFAPSGHAVLMARSLTASPSTGVARLRRMVRDARFSFHRGDMF